MVCDQKLCDFAVIREGTNAKVERCRYCRTENIVKKSPFTTRIDNRTYLKTHRRDFLQPFGRTKRLYRKIYGKPRELAQKKSKKQIKEEWQQTREDALKMDEKLKRRFID